MDVNGIMSASNLSWLYLPFSDSAGNGKFPWRKDEEVSRAKEEMDHG